MGARRRGEDMHHGRTILHSDKSAFPESAFCPTSEGPRLPSILHPLLSGHTELGLKNTLAMLIIIAIFLAFWW